MDYPHLPGWKIAGTNKDGAQAVTRPAKTMRELILTIVNYASSSTATQIAAVLGASVLAVRPRVPELSRSELIEQTAERGETKSGMYARCCRAVVTSRGGA